MEDKASKFQVRKSENYQIIATTVSSSGEILETQIIQVKREKERVGG